MRISLNALGLLLALCTSNAWTMETAQFETQKQMLLMTLAQHMSVIKPKSESKIIKKTKTPTFESCKQEMLFNLKIIFSNSYTIESLMISDFIRVFYVEGKAKEKIKGKTKEKEITKARAIFYKNLAVFIGFNCDLSSHAKDLLADLESAKNTGSSDDISPELYIKFLIFLNSLASSAK